MKRVFLVHCWGGKPEGGWYSWIKDELERRNIKVIIPKMPNPVAPEINSWVNTLEKSVGKADENTYFIGHSVGCQTILRYLETINQNVGGVLFVAGWFNLVNLESKET